MGWGRSQFEEVLWLAKDDPVVVGAVMRLHGEFVARNGGSRAAVGGG